MHSSAFFFFFSSSYRIQLVFLRTESRRRYKTTVVPWYQKGERDRFAEKGYPHKEQHLVCLPGFPLGWPTNAAGAPLSVLFGADTEGGGQKVAVSCENSKCRQETYKLVYSIEYLCLYPVLISFFFFFPSEMEVNLTPQWHREHQCSGWIRLSKCRKRDRVCILLSIAIYFVLLHWESQTSLHGFLCLHLALRGWNGKKNNFRVNMAYLLTRICSRSALPEQVWIYIILMQ